MEPETMFTLVSQLWYADGKFTENEWCSCLAVLRRGQRVNTVFNGQEVGTVTHMQLRGRIDSPHLPFHFAWIDSQKLVLFLPDQSGVSRQQRSWVSRESGSGELWHAEGKALMDFIVWFCQSLLPHYSPLQEKREPWAVLTLWWI